MSTTRILWINTYLPTDPQLVGQYDDEALREVLEEVEGVLANSSYDNVVWGMTRNSHFSRTI